MTAPTANKNNSVTTPKTAAKLALIALIGVGATWFATQKNLAEVLAPNANVDSLRPQPMKGRVLKTLEQFSFSSDEGRQFHISDPNNLLDGIAKQRGIDATLYELSDVCIKGVVSKVGNYGHMGRFERQIIITGLCKT